MNSGQTDIGTSVSAPTGMLIGHFTLAFEDYFGETFTNYVKNSTIKTHPSLISSSAFSSLSG